MDSLSPIRILLSSCVSWSSSYRVVGVLISACLALTACSRNKDSVQQAEPVPSLATMLVIDTRQITPLPEGFFGLNVDAAASVLCWENPRTIEAIRPMHPSMLAYPGYSAANSWDWLSGMAREEWIAQLGAGASSNTLALRTYAERSARFSLLKGGVPLQQFINGCRSLGAQPMCYANVLHQKPEDSAQWLKATRAFGLPAMHWELGNDLWRREYRKAYPSVESYIKMAKAHAAALRSEEPGVRLAVCIPAEALADFNSKKESGKQYKKDSQAKANLQADILARQSAVEREKAYLQSWLGDLALQPFYDAVSLDLNFTLKNNSKTSPDMILYAICRQSQQQLTELVSLQAQCFGEKGIWVSDWGVSIENNPDFPGSLLHSLALAEMALALTKQTPRVERIFLANAAPQLGLTNEKEIQEKIEKDFQKSGQIVKGKNLTLEFGEVPASGQVLRMLGEIYSNSSHLAASELYRPPRLKNNSPAAPDVSEDELPAALNAAAFAGKDGAVRVALINRSPEPQAIRLVINSQQMGGMVRIRSLHGSQLMPNSQMGNNTPAEQEQYGVTLKAGETPTTRIELPPYSFSVVESWMVEPPQKPE